MPIERLVVVVHHTNANTTDQVVGFIVTSGSARKMRWVNHSGEASIETPAPSRTTFDVSNRRGLGLPGLWNQESDLMISAVPQTSVGWSSSDLDSALSELEETYLNHRSSN